MNDEVQSSNGQPEFIPALEEAVAAYKEEVQHYSSVRAEKREIRWNVGAEIAEKYPTMRQRQYYSLIGRNPQVQDVERRALEAFGSFQYWGQMVRLAAAREGIKELPELPGIRDFGESLEHRPKEPASNKDPFHSERRNNFEELCIKILTEQGSKSKSKLMEACFESGWPRNMKWVHSTLSDLADSDESSIVKAKKTIQGRDTHVYSIKQ